MTATTFPVHYVADRPAEYTRIQLLARLVIIVILGAFHISLGALYLLAYLALPVFAAVRLAGGRDPQAYLRDDGARIVPALRWFAAVYAWLNLVSETLPFRAAEETVHVDVEPVGRPTPGSALLRLITGIPSAFFLAVLAWVSMFVWLWAAIVVLFRKRVSNWAFNYLAGVQRWGIRLLGYQASLVDSYPPFSLAEAPKPSLPAPHGV